MASGKGLEDGGFCRGAASALPKEGPLLACETLSRRAAPAFFIYFILWLAYVLALPGSMRALNETYGIGGIMFALGSARTIFHLSGERLMRDNLSRWRVIFATFTLLSILAWTGFICLEMVIHELDATSLLLIVASAGLLSGATHALAPDLRLVRRFAVASSVPPFITSLVLGGTMGHALAWLIVIQIAFALVLGSQLNAEFWGAVISNAERERAETELRLAQKLEAVGRLASGIAHEINTPTQFVAHSVQFASESMGELVRLIEQYRTVYRAVLSGASARSVAADVKAAEEAVRVESLLVTVPESLRDAIQGLDRIGALVRSMKEFAHPDQKEMTSVDLNRAIQTTLTIASNEYKYVADVDTDWGELPPVVCHAGELNQAVLNLIVNAAHAVEEVVGGTSERGRITVRTRRDGDSVVVSVKDTGRGIPAAVRDRIFDPFFTTKEVGKGTGQGLAISRSVIVQKHGGELTFETQEGRGTTFFVRLPIGGKPSKTAR